MTTRDEIRDEYNRAQRERLRDEFAAAALTGLLASEAADDSWLKLTQPPIIYKGIVQHAYAFADAMLAHRDANPLPAPAQAPQ